MPAVSSMATPLRVYMLRIYSVVILVLAINPFKTETNAAVERLRAGLILT